MKHSDLFKKISVLNFWLISVCTIFIFSFIVLFWNIQRLHDAILGATLTFITLTLISYANLLWLYLHKNALTIYLNKRVFYILSYLFCIFIFLLVVVSYNSLSGQLTNFIDIINLLIISVFVNTFIIFLHNYIILQDAKTIADIENSKLKAINAEAANQLLRQQIHPHFFFNALNILKSLYKLDPETADEYLVSLSDFLRMSLSTNNIKIIPFKDELELCHNYLTMQKIRFGDTLKYSVTVPDEIIRNGFIPSFSIQPLIENAIKHNELTKVSPLHISIESIGDRIIVFNNIKSKTTSEPSSGMGLANLAERYQILSGDEIFIENDGATFSVSIKVFDRQF